MAHRLDEGALGQIGGVERVDDLPADIDGKDQTQDEGVPLCGADANGRLTMRDAILVKASRAVGLEGIAPAIANIARE